MPLAGPPDADSWQLPALSAPRFLRNACPLENEGPARAIVMCTPPLLQPPTQQAPSTPSAAMEGKVMMHPGMARDEKVDRPSDRPTPTTAGGKLEGSYL